MRIPDTLLVHEVTVTALDGESSIGLIPGDSFTLRCFVEGKRRMVRSSDGTQVLSELTLYAAPGQAASIPPGSWVTWNGRQVSVLASIDHDSAGLGAPDHTEVNCG